MPPESKSISKAPRDGTHIKAHIPGYGDNHVIAWSDNLMNDREQTCGGWTYIEGDGPPACWHDGVCWASNADDVASVQPTLFKLILPGTANA